MGLSRTWVRWAAQQEIGAHNCADRRYTPCMADDVQSLLGGLDLTPAQRNKLEALLKNDGSMGQGSTLAEDAATINLMPDDSDVMETMSTGGSSKSGNLGEAKLSGGIDRYTNRGLLGRGGMGEVRLVRDRDLGRKIAMKIIRADRVLVPGVLTRFVREAQACAQLEHPGIIPVYDIGRLPDGRIYFTTPVVHGQTLSDFIKQVHDASPEDAWAPADSGWNFHRLIDTVHKVAETMAYAHARGAIHRDLKPENVMIGEWGEVFVMDWGLVKLLGRVSPTDPDNDMMSDAFSGEETQAGVITGTPAYMPPEQARGDIDLIGTWTDVYALGALLYKVLTGNPPYTGRNMLAILRQVDAGPPIAPHKTTSRALPKAIEDICVRAMAPEPEDRFADAGEMAREIAAWLEGARAREHANALLAEAKSVHAEADRLSRKAVQARRDADRLSSFIEPHEVSDDKEEVWALEDEARDLDLAVEQCRVRYVQLLRSALNHVPDLVMAHELLAQHFRTQHELHEQSGDKRAAARFEVLVRTHNQGAHEDYLNGMGRLTIETNPPNAKATLYRYVENVRRLVAEPKRALGNTPVDAPLEMGSYLVTLSAPGHDTVRYPVRIGRQEHWHGKPPRRDAPRPIDLPKKGSLGTHDVYIPAGWIVYGGDPMAVESPKRQSTWIDGFVMRRYPVTNAEYLAFLNDLVMRREERQALQFCPREPHNAAGEAGAVLWTRTAGGRFLLPDDATGTLWEPQQPVVMVNWFAASAYAAWYAKRTGQPWRLPFEQEWEKAARGVDGRVFPSGDFLDPAWACTRGSHAGRPKPSDVTGFPNDVSVYGVRGLAGNVSDWCADRFTLRTLDGDETRVNFSQTEVFQTQGASEQRVSRGGHWKGNRRTARSASRNAQDANAPSQAVGFRLCRDA